MDLHHGLTTHLALKRSAGEYHRPTLSAELAYWLIEEGGGFASLGQQWFDGTDMIERGECLAGWFVGPAQNKRATELIKRGTALKDRAAAQYAKTVTQSLAEDETDIPAKE